MCRQTDNLLTGVLRKSGPGKLVKESPMRKWPGVRTKRSLGSVDIGVKGLELG